jgi:hypothetical protein
MRQRALPVRRVKHPRLFPPHERIACLVDSAVSMHSERLRCRSQDRKLARSPARKITCADPDARGSAQCVACGHTAPSRAARAPTVCASLCSNRLRRSGRRSDFGPTVSRRGMHVTLGVRDSAPVAVPSHALSAPSRGGASSDAAPDEVVRAVARRWCPGRQQRRGYSPCSPRPPHAASARSMSLLRSSGFVVGA